MKKYTFTPDELCELVEKAFRLGKIYATDELNSCRGSMQRIPTWQSEDEWNAFVEFHKGITLHSGEAKTEIILEAIHESHAYNEDMHRTFQMD